MTITIHRPIARLMIAGLLATASAVVYATIPDAAGVFDGCYSNKDGLLRVIDPSAGSQCSSKETPIQWSQTGPQGLQGSQGSQGQQGPQGPVGPQGPTGPSDAYQILSGENMVLCDQTMCQTTLGSVIVPAGSYVISAKLVFSNWSSTGTAQSFCYVYEDGTSGPWILDSTAAATTTTISFVPASLLATATYSSPTTLSLKCANNNGQTSAQTWRMIATKVGTVQY